jgi:putative heme-binding domain-containing protein
LTCEPTGNLIHQEVLRPTGGTFRGHPSRHGVEFLATPDDWFRPVSLAPGPDGALYVVDMYRAVIEHPEFMPPELKDRPDLTLGKDRGRIWRIVPAGHKGKPIRPRLSKATTAQLVGLLAHADGWWRTTAQRLLLERQDRSAMPPLRKLCAESPRPLARLHAAWLLEGFGALDADLLDRLLRDSHPRLREQAVLLAERRLAGAPALQKRLLALADDPDARVRFQLALTLGEWDDPRILKPLAQIAEAGLEDRWTRLAVASAVPRRAGALLALLLGKGEPAPARLALLQELAALVGARRDPAEVGALLQKLFAAADRGAVPWQLAVLNGLADGLGRRGGQLGVVLKALPASYRPAVRQTEALLGGVAALAADAKKAAGERLAATRLLAHAPWKIAGPALRRLLADERDQQLRLAAVRALAAQPSPEVSGLLMKSWRAYTPAVRREVTEAMLRQPERALFLLEEVAAGRVKPGDIDALRTRQLLSHSRAEVRKRASKLLRGSLPAERKAVLAKYAAALKLKGDARRGQAVFAKNCATCHRVAGVGIDVGPDIADTRTKTAAMLLNDILEPNAAIDANYINYLVTTKSGKVLSGIIVTETASSLTLRRAENQTDVVLRQDIEALTSTGASLMPEGLEKNISVAEMADLLSFLKNWRYLDGAVPLRERAAKK